MRRAAEPVAVRVCETSAALGALPCTHLEALEVAVQGGAGATLSVSCPAQRGGVEVGGHVSVLAAPMVPGQASSVSCSVAE